jgi:hypothetical protein
MQTMSLQTMLTIQDHNVYNSKSHSTANMEEMAGCRLNQERVHVYNTGENRTLNTVFPRHPVPFQDSCQVKVTLEASLRLPY